MLAGDGPPAAPCALQCEALKEEACHAPICTTGDRVQRVRLVTAHRPRPEAERSRLVTTERALLASCVTAGVAALNTDLFGWEINSPRSIAIYLPAIRCFTSGEAKRQARAPRTAPDRAHQGHQRRAGWSGAERRLRRACPNGMPATASAAVAAVSSTEATATTPSALCGLLNSFVDALTEEREVMANAELGCEHQPVVRSAPATPRRNSTGTRRRAQSPPPPVDNSVLSAVSMGVNEKLIAENGRLREEIRHLKLVADLEHEKAPTAALERENRLLLEANGELTEECSRLGEECNDTHRQLTAALARGDELEAMCENLRRQLDKPAGPGLWASPVDKRWAPASEEPPPPRAPTSSGGRTRKVSSGSVGSSSRSLAGSSRNLNGSSRSLPGAGSSGQPASGKPSQRGSRRNSRDA